MKPVIRPWPRPTLVTPPRAARGRHLGLRLVLIGVLLLQVPGLAVSAPAPTGDDAHLAQAARLLERMNTALRSLDYQGTLVYLIDNRLETLHLVHRVEQGRVQEQLISLSGPVRTVTRERDRVTCAMPNGRPIQVRSRFQPNFTQPEPIDPQALTDRYRIEIPGSARVAGRDADVVAILPRDHMRYGYRFHLDRATGLPLKSDLIDDQGEAIEQLLFTTIDLGSTPSDPAPGDTVAAAQTDPSPTHWRFDERPAGFERASHDAMEDAQGAKVDHFVFSDRLSSYSVYIEDNIANGLTGVTRIGAVHAAGRVVDGHQVTAVGEVPAATVEAAVAGARWSRQTGP
jgi:sigma-E factor negative regulatory protein RseB